jgi:ABC-type transport system substrate-binding protein
MKKYSIPFAILLLAILLLSACGSKTSPSSTAATTNPAATTPVNTTSKPPASTTTAPTTAAQPVYGGTWTLMSDTTVTNLNPPADGGTLSARYLAPVLEPLLRLTADGKLVGHLAESWEVSADGKTVTFHIRKGVKFSDGTSLTASVVKYNLGKTATSGIFGVSILKVATSYDVVDDYTLRANLSGYNYSYFTALAGMAGMIASQTALEKPATDATKAKLHLVGTGPFTLRDWKQDDRVTYDKNPNYWQTGKPYLDTIVLRYIADRTVALMAFQAGEADEWATGLELATSNMLETQGYKITPYPLRWQHSMAFDSANSASPFANEQVREALSYGVDKLTVVNGIGGGAKRGYAPLYQIAEPVDAWYVASLPPRLYDLAKAKQMLTTAGYPNGFKTTLFSDTFAEKPFLEALQLELKKMGIDATLDIGDFGRMTSTLMGGWTGLLHQGFPTSSTPGGLQSRWGDPSTYVSMLKPAGWTDGWASMISEQDDSKRIAKLQELVKLDYNQALTFSWRADAPFGVNNGTSHGFVLHIGGAADYWWPETVWKDKAK